MGKGDYFWVAAFLGGSVVGFLVFQFDVQRHVPLLFEEGFLLFVQLLLLLVIGCGRGRDGISVDVVRHLSQIGVHHAEGKRVYERLAAVTVRAGHAARLCLQLAEGCVNPIAVCLADELEFLRAGLHVDDLLVQHHDTPVDVRHLTGSGVSLCTVVHAFEQVRELVHQLEHFCHRLHPGDGAGHLPAHLPAALCVQGQTADHQSRNQ